MNACPNINSPEWKKNVARVGELETYRDYITHGDIRSTAEVEYSVNNRKQRTPLSQVNQFLAQYNSAVSNSAYVSLAKQLSNNLDIEFTLITATSAAELLSAAGKEYNGEPAFFFQNKVYLLPNEINETTVLHEFAHPVVFGIHAENKKLFDNLYAEAIAIPGIQEHVESNYADKSELEQQMEAIVYGMTAANQQSPKAKSFLEKVTYAIKQLFRKIFGGKVNVAKLNANTTLGEIVDMMRGVGFNLQYERDITDNLVMFIRDYTKFYDTLGSLDATKIETMFGYVQSGARQIVSQVSKNNNLDERYPKLFKNEDNLDIINIILGELKIKTLTEAERAEASDKLLQTIASVNIKTLSHSIAQLEKLSENMTEVADDVLANKESFKIEDAVALHRIANAYSEMATALHEMLRANGVNDRNAVRQALGKISTNYLDAAAKIAESQRDFLVDFMYDKLSGIREDLTRRMKDQLEVLRKQEKDLTGDAKVRKQKEIAQLEADANTALSREFIKELLNGQRGDVGSVQSKLVKSKALKGWLNKFGLPKAEYIENFLNVSDPVLGTFGMYLNDVYNTAESEIIQNGENFRPIYKELQAAGLDNNNPQAFFSTLTYVDSIAGSKAEQTAEDETAVEVFEAYSLLNPFKDYLFAIKDIRSRINIAREKGDNAALNELEGKKQELEKFFHRPYIKEYYAAYEKFNTPIGIIASNRRKDIYTQIEDIDIDMIANLNMADEDYQELVDRKKELLREARQLSSLTDEFGNPKTGVDLEVAQLLRQHKEDTKNFFEYEQIEGLFELRLKRFEEALVEQGLSPTSEAFALRRDQWIQENTVVSIKPIWRQLKKDILDEIKLIQGQLPIAGVIAKEYERIFDLTLGYQDENGHVVGGDMTDDALVKVKKAQERIEEAKQQMAAANGLTKSEYEELQDLFAKKDNDELSDSEIDRLRQLLKTKKEKGLSPQLLNRLNYLFSQLRDISSTEFTDDYVSVWEAHLSRLGAEDQYKDLFTDELRGEIIRGLNTGSIQGLLQDSTFMNTIMQDSVFSTWFNNNHYEKSFFKDGQMVDGFVPSYAWTYSKPKDPDAYETTIIEETGEEIARVPSLSFTRRKVKSEYITKRVVGETIDVFGNYLPDLSVANNPFRNEKYFELKNNDPKKFEALTKLNKWYIDQQLNMPVGSRLGYQVPRFSKDSLEYAQDIVGGTTSFSERFISPIKDIVNNVVSPAADDIDKYNYTAPGLILSEFVSDETNQIPIQGLSRLEKGQVSLNASYSILKYTNSAIIQSNLVKSNPIAKSFLDVTEQSSERTIASSKLSGVMAVGSQIAQSNRGKVSDRYKALRDMYNKAWLGQQLSSDNKYNKGLVKIIGAASRAASLSYFAINIPSAVKNRIAAIVQNNIEAVGSKDITIKGYARGKGLAKKALVEISTTTTSTEARSLLTNLAMVFNIDGGLEKSMDYTHRTLLRSTVGLKFLMAPRKFLQLDSALELLYSLLASKTIQVTENGTTKTISLVDAYEMRNGQLVTKAGVPQEWSTTGKEFLKFKRLVDGKMNRLQGTYKDIQQPLLNRYALGKVILFLRKYFVSMLMHRLAPYRAQYDTERIEAGFYRSGTIFLINVVKDMQMRMKTGNWDVSYSLNTEIEFEGAKKMGFETIQLAVMGTLLRMILMAAFGYDPEDPEKKSQSLLKDPVGPLPTPLNADTDREFDFSNWLIMHSALQLQQVSDEAMVFYPGSTVLDAMDANDLSETNLFSTFVQLDPLAALYNGSVQRGMDIITLSAGAMSGEDDAYFSRDVGPYWFQQADQPKVYQEMAKIIGVNGKTVDPADAYIDWRAGLRLRK